MSPQPCIVSLATGHGAFPAALERLAARLRGMGFAGELLLWRPGEMPPGCPAHMDVPFGFKTFALDEARRRGFGPTLWLDSACLPVRPLEPLFAAIARDGYLVYRHGRERVGEWASDAALAWFGLDREAALAIPEVMGAAIGLDLGSTTGSAFLDAWHAAALAAVPFRGVAERLETRADYQAVKWNRDGRVSADPRVRGHRHDQTVAGILAHRFGFTLAPRAVHSYRPGRRLIPPSARLVLERGLGRKGARPTAVRRLLAGKALGWLFARG